MRRRVLCAVGNLLVVALFCGTIYAPGFAFLDGIQPEQIENRTLHGLPQIGPDFFDEFSAFLQDHLPLRAQAIQLQTWIGLNVFGDSPSVNVLLGKNGWLFYAREYSNACAFATDFAGVFYGVGHLDDVLRSYGKRFMFVIVPDKTDFYRDYASVPMQIRTSAACVDERRASLRQLAASFRPGVFLDLWTPLEKARSTSEGQALYRPLDTHWNDRGMLVAARELVNTLDPGLWEEADVVSVGTEDSVGDLTILMGSPRREPVDHVAVKRPGSEVISETLTIASGAAYTSFEAHGDAPRLGPTVLLTDSFFELTTNVLPPYFDELRYVPMPLRDTDALYCSITEAQMVIFTVAERSIYEPWWWTLGDDNPRLASALTEGKDAPSCR